MYGTIKTIEEVSNEKYERMDGYKISTDKNTFMVLISNGQSCCEHWGYLSSEDDLEHFIGSELREVRTTDVECNGNIAKLLEERWIELDSVQFVDFVTNRGVLQFAVYNEHNGYYGHNILLSLIHI